ncbi:MAG: arginine repressor [Clostridiales Family XIII bacterium]|jgi:transcriptional regulator of arginine metabolism|nr:arginine repressor [Clostridiales Family XIII bacterium]
MRYSRQNKILDIISTHQVDTQERLAELLKENGFSVTQATVSRDIRELQLLKTLTSDGKYKYVANSFNVQNSVDRFAKIFRETIQSVSDSGNIIVIKTLSGCANAAAETIDSMSLPNILGSIAGDNTIFLVVNEPQNVASLVSRFKEMLRYPL